MIGEQEITRRGLRDGADIPRARGADAVRAKAFGHPQALATGELDHHPGLVRVGDDVRIAAVAGIAVLGDQGGDQVHALARGAGTLQHQAGKVGIVRPGLVGRRHVDQLLTRGRPDVAHGDAMFVQPAIGDRRRHAKVIAIADTQVARRLRRLRDMAAPARQVGLRPHAHLDHGTGGVFRGRHDFQPMAGRLVAVAGKEGDAIGGVVAADINAVAHSCSAFLSVLTG